MESQKTRLETPQTAERGWVVVDVTDKVVGRAASRIADILRGKHRASFTPHVDAGDFVVVLNAAKLRFTGNKLDDKNYYSHSGYFGGMKSISAGQQLEKHPDRVLRDAVWGMLPKNTLSKHIIKKLKIYPGSEHPHAAQSPTEIKL
ncbi:MAG: 50S ribosomal protein L13 [Proteobacteria bacterium]|nr:50S ribosomal protein L13 [Pseudomonadota bacterium]